MYLLRETQFVHIHEICELVLNADSSYVELYNQVTPGLIKCLSKYPEQSILLFFTDLKLKVWLV